MKDDEIWFLCLKESESLADFVALVSKNKKSRNFTEKYRDSTVVQNSTRAITHNCLFRILPPPQ